MQTLPNPCMVPLEACCRSGCPDSQPLQRSRHVSACAPFKDSPQVMLGPGWLAGKGQVVGPLRTALPHAMSCLALPSLKKKCITPW